jgi:ATP-dependent RNA helicase HelY
MMYGTYLWARGKSLDEILSTRDISGGDFVRALKSVVDLLRQIKSATPDQDLIDICTAAEKLCFRDIVEISS